MHQYSNVISPYGTIPVLPPPPSSTCGDSELVPPPSLPTRLLRWLTSCWDGGQRTAYRVHSLQAGEVEPLLDDEVPNPPTDEKGLFVIEREMCANALKGRGATRLQRKRTWVPCKARKGFLKTAAAKIMRKEAR